DGIRDFHVTGVQTCALPIFLVHAEELDLLRLDGLGLRRRALVVDLLGGLREVAGVRGRGLVGRGGVRRGLVGEGGLRRLRNRRLRNRRLRNRRLRNRRLRNRRLRFGGVR